MYYFFDHRERLSATVNRYICQSCQLPFFSPTNLPYLESVSNPGFKREISTKVYIGNVHGSQKEEELIQDFKADYLIADKRYESKTTVEFAKNNGMNVVIPSRSNVKNPQNYNKKLYNKDISSKISSSKSRDLEVFQ